MPAAYATKPDPTVPAHMMLNAITDPMRWRILEVMPMGKQRKAAEIAAELGDVLPANVQYHLKTLVKLGLVSEFPDPEYKNRYVYSRNVTIKGSLVCSKQGLKADISFA